LYHWYELIPEVAVSVSLDPEQIDPIPEEVIPAVGGVLIVTAVAVVVVLQPSAFVTVTL
jgi:hypothetical protein